MVITCGIELDKKVVYAGQTLSGTIYLTSTGKKKIRGVKMHIVGGSLVKVRLASMTYSLEQCILDSEMYVVGSIDGTIQLTSGVRRFKFQFKLSPDLPSTISGHPIGGLAFTFYEIRIVVDIPFWKDRKCITPFTVIKPRNLSLHQKLQVPLAVETVERFPLNCLLLWNTSRPLFIDALIPVRGYCPDETINLELDVRNSSQQNVTKFTVMLRRRITCYYNKNLTEPSHEDASISKQETRGCKSNEDEKIQVNVKVPVGTSPTDTSTATIIKVEYFIEIIGHVEIGTVPLRGRTKITSRHVVEYLSTPPPCVTLKERSLNG